MFTVEASIALLGETVPVVDHSLVEELLPEVKSGALFCSLQAVTFGLVSIIIVSFYRNMGCVCFF